MGLSKQVLAKTIGCLTLICVIAVTGAWAQPKGNSAKNLASGKAIAARPSTLPLTQNRNGGPSTVGDQLTAEQLSKIKFMVMDSPPHPPAGSVRPVVKEVSKAARIMPVPTSTWTYGCSATSAGMLFGYYDRNGYPDMYTGPANGGVVPLTDVGQGIDVPIATACSIIATQNGFDGRTTRGHVNDYWISYDSAGPDPWVGNWAEHTWSSCTADYMGTNQWKWDFDGAKGAVDSNTDGGTTFFFNEDGSPLYDYIPPSSSGTPQTELCHGMRLFAESRGYTVTATYTQLVDSLVSGGFSFNQYMQEINADRPVLIHVEGHTMVGVGYDSIAGDVYLNDTWDNSVHTMTWGGSYADMLHIAVTVLQLEPAGEGEGEVEGEVEGEGVGDCENNLVQDSSFELGTPNTVWTEYSSNFGTPLCTLDGCGSGGGTGPHSGNWWCWFGGTTEVEEGSMEQSVTLPSAASAYLSFYLEIPVAETTGYMRVRMDGDLLFEATEASAAAYGSYSYVQIPVSAYADGNTHLLRFESMTNGGGNLNFFVDDICLTVEGESTCATIATLACNATITGSNNGQPSLINGYSCTAWDESGPDALYGFSVPQDTQVTISIGNLSADLDLFILEDSCLPENCIEYGDTWVEFSAEAGRSYIVVVDGYNGAVSDFTLQVDCAPVEEGEGESPVHPGDGNADWRMQMGEAISYLSGWQQGSNPMAYAIRAAYLWQNGEYYLYDGGQTPPLCWVLAK